MPARYYQGTSVQGPVKESAARTFREVVDTFRMPPTLGITRAAFLALDKKERNEAKQVPFFTPACFEESTSKRTYQNAKECNLLFIDLDEQKDGKCPAAPFVANPDLLYAALGDFNFIAHTTASSTPEKPRMRIVIDASGIPLRSYVSAVLTIGAMLGVTINAESKVAVQPMFLPTLFSDSNGADHPVLAYRFENVTFLPEHISSNLPNAPQKLNGHSHPNAGTDQLDFLRAPIPEISLGIAKEALSKIDPDCSYAEWLEIAAALKHQYSPHQTQEAYEAFDNWSQEGSKYGGSEETRAKWDSLRSSPIGRLPVTIRSLLRLAVSSGWDDGRTKESCFQSLLRWMDTVPTMAQLVEEGVKKILAAPLLSHIQEGLLVGELVKQTKRRFAFTVSTQDIRKDLARLRQEIKSQDKPTEKTKEPVWAKGVCYVAAAQEFFRHYTGQKYKPESFNASYGRNLLPTEEALRQALIPVTPANLAKPIVTPNDYALNHLKIPAVYEYAYDPSRPTEIFFTHRQRRYVNIYTPTYPELDYSKAEEAGKLFLAHLANLIREPEYRQTLVDYMAFMVQQPGIKILWAVLIQGTEGCGKTFLGEAMRAVLGKEHVKTVSNSIIKSGYNDWAFGHQLVVIEEIRAAGTNRHEVMNTLKELITNQTVPINQKFRSAYEAINISNYMLFSNHHDALALTPGDRRYFVIKSPLQAKSQVLALGDNYFRELFNMLQQFAGGLRAFLTDWQISSDFQPNGHAPKTKYVDELVTDTASDLTSAIRRLMIEGDYPLVQFDIVSARVLADALNLEGLTRATAQQVAQVLREEGFEQLGRTLLAGERHYLWVRHGADPHSAPTVAAERLKSGAKNLQMEIFF